MTRALVLGGGMIGAAVAFDLRRRPGWQVTVADRSASVLAAIAARHGVRTLVADLSDPAEAGRLARDADVVVGALPSVLGLATLRAVLAPGRPYCDVSFMPEEALDLHAEARSLGAVAVVDCGVAPGVSNLVAGHAVARFDRCERLDILVGGLPRRRAWPFDFKAAFAPGDVIEEYVRPARFVEHGELVVREALSEPEPVDFPEIGTLEAVNTDGLRSLARTLDIPFMKEKTLRYPGHAGLMRAFRATGLFDTEPVDVDGHRIRPRDATAAVLFPRWRYEEGEEDLTLLRIRVEGTHAGRPFRWSFDLTDRYDPATRMRSMSRTTAFPAAIVAAALAEGRFAEPGVWAPERLGAEPGLADHVLGELRARGVQWSDRLEWLAPTEAELVPAGALGDV